MIFSGVITNDRRDVHAKGQGQRSKVTEVTTQLNRFRTVTQVWIHIWWWNYALAWYCLEEVPYCFSRLYVKFQGHTALKIVKFDPDWAFPDCNWSLNSPMATRWCTKLEVALKFQGHTALKFVEFDPNWPFPDSNSSSNTPMATKWCTKLEVE